MGLRLVATVVASALPFAAAATNGLNLIGFGTESVAMGGADTAVARDTSALNTNPAGLGQLARPALDAYMAAAFALDVGHSDSLGNDRSVDNKVVPVGGFGVSRPYAGGKLVAAVGFFAQGGAGAVYKGLRTAFGSTDELSAQVGFRSATSPRRDTTGAASVPRSATICASSIRRARRRATTTCCKSSPTWR